MISSMLLPRKWVASFLFFSRLTTLLSRAFLQEVIMFFNLHLRFFKFFSCCFSISSFAVFWALRQPKSMPVFGINCLKKLSDECCWVFAANHFTKVAVFCDNKCRVSEIEWKFSHPTICRKWKIYSYDIRKWKKWKNLLQENQK